VVDTPRPVVVLDDVVMPKTSTEKLGAFLASDDLFGNVHLPTFGSFDPYKMEVTKESDGPNYSDYVPETSETVVGRKPPVSTRKEVRVSRPVIAANTAKQDSNLVHLPVDDIYVAVSNLVDCSHGPGKCSYGERCNHHVKVIQGYQRCYGVSCKFQHGGAETKSKSASVAPTKKVGSMKRL
jgi:hypothetical protein